MKKFKKLIPALCMLLVSAVMLGSTTYAWFSMNKTVTATGMEVSAKADNPFLLISKTSSTADDFENEVALDKTGTDLKLILPLNLGTAVNYYADAEAAKSGTTTTPTIATKSAEILWGTAVSSKTNEVQADNTTTLVAAAGLEGNYYVSQKLWIKVADEGADGVNLTASCELNGTTTNSIASSVRVLLITENGKYVIFDKDGVVKGGNAKLADTLTAKKTTPAVTGTVEEITVYMYFDGTDDSAKTENATDLTAVKVDLAFKID